MFEYPNRNTALPKRFTVIFTIVTYNSDNLQQRHFVLYFFLCFDETSVDIGSRGCFITSFAVVSMLFQLHSIWLAWWGNIKERARNCSKFDRSIKKTWSRIVIKLLDQNFVKCRSSQYIFLASYCHTGIYYETYLPIHTSCQSACVFRNTLNQVNLRWSATEYTTYSDRLVATMLFSIVRVWFAEMIFSDVACRRLDRITGTFEI